MDSGGIRAFKSALGVRLASIALLLAFLALLTFDLARDRAARERESEQRVAAASQYLANQLSDTLRDIDLVFDALGDNPLVAAHLNNQPLSQRERDQLRHFVSTSIERIAYLSQIRIVDFHCAPAFSSQSGRRKSLPDDLCAWMHEEGRRNDIFFTASAGAGGNDEILHAARLYDAQHNVIGMAVAELAESSMQSMFANAAAGERGEVLIFDRFRHQAAAWPARDSADAQPAAAPRQMLWQEDKHQIYRAGASSGRTPLLYSERQLDNYPLTVAVGRDTSADRAAFYWQLGSDVLVWLLLAVLVRWGARQQVQHLCVGERLLACSEALHDSEQRWRGLLAAVPLGIVLVDTESEHVHFANPAARALLDWGNPDDDWRAGGTDDPLPRFQLHPVIEWLRQGHLAHDQDIEIERDTQTRLWVRISMHNLRVEGRTQCMITLTDRSEHYRLAERLADHQQQLDAMARTDMLTRLANRKSAEQALSGEIHRSQRYDLPLSLACFDIDHFHDFNERYGRQAGDNVLIAVANTLVDCTRATDVCARIADEEFMVVFTNTSIDYAYQVVERIRSKVAATIFPFAEHNVTFSGGITCWRLGDSAEALAQRAENLMNDAKHAGGNQLMCDETLGPL